MQFGSLKSAWILYFEFATNPDRAMVATAQAENSS